ncbi:MAG: UDP-galactopyranose mutase [Eubacteriales bacterium]
MKYDYLIVGAGLSGAVFAQQRMEEGKSVLVIDRRSHLAGNMYTEECEGIHVHKYGAHIFHTNKEAVWEYVNKFAEFMPFINSPVANYQGKIYNLPFNMNTFAKMWDIATPEEAKEIIAKQVAERGITEPKNLEEKAISLVGTDIYEALIRGYTEKQWGKSCQDLPAFIINRLPLRFTYDNNYFNAKYQGIPVGGYTKMIETMFSDCEIRLNTEFSSFWEEKGEEFGGVFYTGSVDELMGYELGALEYRGLKFEEKVLDTDNFQGNAVVNYTEREVPYTRVIEHKFFEHLGQEKTVVSYEYPSDWRQGDEAYYPVNNEENQAKYEKYVDLIRDKYPNMVLGGRLGLYRYLDMDQVVGLGLE